MGKHQKIEVRTQHVTPANGNIFLDLIFEPELAAKLLAEVDIQDTHNINI